MATKYCLRCPFLPQYATHGNNKPNGTINYANYIYLKSVSHIIWVEAACLLVVNGQFKMDCIRIRFWIDSNSQVCEHRQQQRDGLLNWRLKANKQIMNRTPPSLEFDSSFIVSIILFGISTGEPYFRVCLLFNSHTSIAQGYHQIDNLIYAGWNRISSVTLKSSQI